MSQVWDDYIDRAWISLDEAFEKCNPSCPDCGKKITLKDLDDKTQI